jgi:hypothetical protein
MAGFIRGIVVEHNGKLHLKNEDWLCPLFTDNWYSTHTKVKVGMKISAMGTDTMVPVEDCCVMVSAKGGPWFQSKLITNRWEVSRALKVGRRNKQVVKKLGFEYYQVGGAELQIAAGGLD